ncbi:MAG: flap endonuclease-1 [Candidatus Thermoplasmatota archaeon]|nr:flap endonuclease-1 [Candidatus Thermoplasmatota archaeon]
MGVNLKSLANPRVISLEELKGKIIAIDAHNALYQFLSIIRQRDGTPLKDAEGNITSHLTGLLYRTANMVELGIKPVYVFDGKPHPLKMETLRERSVVKKKAMEEWEKALEKGDMEEARKKAQQTSILNEERVNDAKKLLQALAIPYIEAPGEGEAQASFMNMKGDADATCSQDFDCLLFGAPTLLRNMAITGRRKLPGRQKWMDVSPERIILQEVLSANEIMREQLIDMAILVGTDFNKGVKGIGPMKALKLIKEYGKIEEAVKAGKIGEMTNLQEIRNIFLNPSVTNDYSIEWKKIDEDETIDFLCNKHQFSEERVSHTIKKFKVFSESFKQKNLLEF